MNRKIERILPFILAALMISVTGFTSYAQAKGQPSAKSSAPAVELTNPTTAELQEAISEAEDNYDPSVPYQIKINGNVTLTDMLSISKDSNISFIADAPIVITSKSGTSSASNGTIPPTYHRHLTIDAGTDVTLTFINVILDGATNTGGLNAGKIAGGINGNGDKLTINGAVIQNCTYGHNFIFHNGGGITSTGDLTLNDSVITNCLSSEVGGVYCEGILTVNNGEISNNRITWSGGIGGGGVWGTTVYINGAKINGNTDYTTKSGGGIHATSVYVYGNAEISENINTYNGGGGIYASNVSVYGNAVIKNNKNLSNNSGDGIYATGTVNVYGNAKIIDHISKNSAAGVRAGTVNVYDHAEISNNHADSGYGGGINAAVINVYGNAVIKDNSAERGGAIYNGSGASKITISENAVIKNNTANIGGGIYAYTGSFIGSANGYVIVKDNVKIIDNKAVISDESYAGGIYAVCSGLLAAGAYANLTVTIKDHAVISGNEASAFGGGICAPSTSGSDPNYSVMLNIEGGTISGNKASQGGGISIHGSSMKITGGHIINNTAVADGGGIYGETLGALNAGIEMEGGQISGNTANCGGGMNAAANTVINVSDGEITNNTAIADGGGIFMSELSNLTVGENTIFRENTACAAYYVSDQADKELHKDKIKTHTFSAAPSGADAFDYAYNNFDVNYTKDTKVEFLTVTFDRNFQDAPAPTTQKVAIGNKAVNPAEPERTGYSFDGWFDAATGGNAWDFNTVVTDNIILYAHWTQNTEHTVTYDPNTGAGAVTDQSSPYYNGSIVTVLDKGNMAKANHTFAGWNTQADGEGTAYASGDKFTMPRSNVILYAVWSENASYAVAYDANTGTGTVTDQSSPYYNGSTVTILDKGNMAKANHTFAGWNTQADGKGTAYAAGDEFTLSGDVTLYAVWSENASYAVAYDANTGTGTVTDQNSPYYSGSTVIVMDKGNMAKDNHKFMGWNTRADGKGTAYAAGDALILSDKDIVLYAQWKVQPGNTYDKDITDDGKDKNDDDVTPPVTGENGIDGFVVLLGLAFMIGVLVISFKKRSMKNS